MSWSDLAERCGISAQTAQRRVQRIAESGAIQLRCHVSLDLADRPQPISYLCNVPSAHLDRAGATLRARHDCRLVVAVAGRYNLFVHLWLPSLDAASTVEQELARALPHLVIHDRLVVARTAKRLGSILDEEGRRVHQGTLALW